MQDFFTNELLINAKAETVSAILADPFKWRAWDSEIQTVTETSDAAFTITRTSNALNPIERIAID